MKKTFVTLFVFIILVSSSYGLIKFWPYIFSKDIEGQVIKVERLVDPMAVAVMNGQEGPSTKMFSFAVAVKDQTTGEIFTGSTEDRQWAAVEGDGFCGVARFFPYAPWQLEKAGTYFGVRLLKLWACTDKKPEQ